jgi:hypothetical protein
MNSDLLLAEFYEDFKGIMPQFGRSSHNGLPSGVGPMTTANRLKNGLWCDRRS